jgi:hypothetical protein
MIIASGNKQGYVVLGLESFLTTVKMKIPFLSKAFYHFSLGKTSAK